MGLLISGRLIEALYKSCLLGLQKQVLFNALNSAFSVLRHLGAVGVLAWYSPTLNAFFGWQILVTSLAILSFAVSTYTSLPFQMRHARCSFAALTSIRKFAGGVFAISAIAVILTQLDKIILTRYVSLEDFGYYTLAALVAGSLHMVISPITQALYPRFCQLHAQKNYDLLAKNFHYGAQLISVIPGSIALVILWNSEAFLIAWTGDIVLAQNSAPYLSILMIGYLVHGLYWMPYHLQLSYGWVRLAFYSNLISVAIVVPTLMLFVPLYGPKSAAWVWVLINIGYILIGAHFMYSYILRGEKYIWYKYDIIYPITCGCLSVFALNLIQFEVSTQLERILVLSLTLCCTLIASSLGSNAVRSLVFDYFNQKLQRR